jgi:hypothetical protein
MSAQTLPDRVKATYFRGRGALAIIAVTYSHAISYSQVVDWQAGCNLQGESMKHLTCNLQYSGGRRGHESQDTKGEGQDND